MTIDIVLPNKPRHRRTGVNIFLIKSEACLSLKYEFIIANFERKQNIESKWFWLNKI